jgi:hypothetical protein
MVETVLRCFSEEVRSMSESFPFSGKAGRVAIYSFFEKHALSLPLQEQYYKWWYDWAKNAVLSDPDLRYAKGVEFAHEPYGQHAEHNFHLHDYRWAVALEDLGKFIEHTLLPRLTPAQKQALLEAHDKMFAELLARRPTQPRPPAPDVGRFRHV